MIPWSASRPPAEEKGVKVFLKRRPIRDGTIYSYVLIVFRFQLSCVPVVEAILVVIKGFLLLR